MTDPLTTTPPAPLLLTGREAARMLSVSERTLWALSHSGRIAHIAIGRRGVRYSLADLEAWIAAARRPAAPGERGRADD